MTELKQVGSVFRLWCEWDIGQEYSLFNTYEAAEQYIEDNIDLEDVGFDIIQDVYDDGLVGIEEVKILG